MPASFFTYDGGDIFKQISGGAQDLIAIPMVDDMVRDKSVLAIYDSITLQIGETIQYFLTFDDVIKFIHFGKGVGSLVVEGTLFGDCDGNIPGLAKFKTALSALRGIEQSALIGNIVVTVIMTNAQVTVVGDPDTMAKFNYTFSVVNHSL